MGSERVKLFIGGISWETTEEGLKKHFEAYGNVVEATIMKDRSSGRSRGFGFVILSDSSIADSVLQDEHTVDGKMVEVKKAVPRDDQHSNTRINSGGLGSALQTTAKKVFIGGLASTVTEIDFREYFQQFGSIVDAVVMFDQITQRPRGFGFITYDSEDAIDKVMTKTFHELKGKIVEVKKAIPKELSSAVSRSTASGPSVAMSRGGNSGCGFGQGCISSLEDSYGGGMKMIGADTPEGTGVFLPYKGSHKSSDHGIHGGYRPGLVGSYGGCGFGSNPVYGRTVGYTGNNAGNGGSSTPSLGRNMWSNGGIGCGITGTSNVCGFLGGPESSCFDRVQAWGLSQTVAQRAIGRNLDHYYRNYGFGVTENDYRSLGSSYARKGNRYDVGFVPYFSANVQENNTLDFKGPKWKLNVPESRPLPVGYEHGSNVVDSLASYAPYEITGRQTNTGVAV